MVMNTTGMMASRDVGVSAERHRARVRALLEDGAASARVASDEAEARCLVCGWSATVRAADATLAARVASSRCIAHRKARHGAWGRRRVGMPRWALRRAREVGENAEVAS